MTLSDEQITAHLTRLSYKPGWKFEWKGDFYHGKWEGPHLVIWTRVPDAFSDSTVDLDVHCFLSPNDIASEEALETYIAYRLARIETHEMREFLKRDRKVIDSPHAPEAHKDAVTREYVGKDTRLNYHPQKPVLPKDGDAWWDEMALTMWVREGGTWQDLRNLTPNKG